MAGSTVGARLAPEPGELVSINPVTGNLVERFPEAGPDEIDLALDAAARCFASWSSLPARERSTVLWAAADRLRARRGELARLVTTEMGKPIRESEAEVDKCAWVCEYYAEHAPSLLADQPVATEAESTVVRHRPIGPVLAIMPWNFPLWQVFRAAVPAIAAGNTVVLKHASNVPGSSLAAAEVWREAGMPEGGFQALLVGANRVPQLIADDRIRAVTFTGSTEAGARVAEQAARALKKHVLELGGSDPFIVLDDADLAEAARVGARARTQNGGQSCIAAKRFIVHAAVADEFVSRLAAELDGLQLGDPLEPETDIGPLARPDLVDTLLGQVRRSVAEGAVVVRGGSADGPFFQPTLVDHARPTMAVCAEETFGPVAAVLRVADDEEAISVANATPFGLGASIWTRSAERASRMLDGVEAGAVYVNRMVASDPRLPIGGTKKSGYGRELGRLGLLEFVSAQTVWIESLSGVADGTAK